MIDASLLENPNLAMLEIAVQALGDLCESLVFVGGCATGLLVTSGSRLMSFTQARVMVAPALRRRPHRKDATPEIRGSRLLHWRESSPKCPRRAAHPDYAGPGEPKGTWLGTRYAGSVASRGPIAGAVDRRHRPPRCTRPADSCELGGRTGAASEQH